MKTENNKEFIEETKRLAELPEAEQRAIIAWHRDIAADPKVKKADRQTAADRAKALETLLFRAGEKKKRSKQKP